VLEELTWLFAQRGAPGYIRSDNGPEFTAQRVRKWLGDLSVKTLFIEPGSPWENGYVESFNGKLRDELVNVEIFDTLHEAQVLVERWRKHYNTVRPHSSLGYRPPGPGGVVALGSGLRPAQPSAQGCMTGRPVPHCNWYHLWGQVSIAVAQRTTWPRLREQIKLIDVWGDLITAPRWVAPSQPGRGADDPRCGRWPGTS